MKTDHCYEKGVYKFLFLFVNFIRINSKEMENEKAVGGLKKSGNPVSGTEIASYNKKIPIPEKELKEHMIHIENVFISAEIMETGGTLHSLKWKETGAEYLWQGDPAYWRGQAPTVNVLFLFLFCCKSLILFYNENI